MNVSIVTPEGVVYQDKQIESLTLPTKAGVITIKDDHVPMISIVSAGEMNLDKDEGHTVNLAISGGVVEIKRESEIIILADTAERAEDIDIERAEEARKRAQEFLKKKEDIADFEFAKLQAKIEKELARIHVGKKYKNVRL